MFLSRPRSQSRQSREIQRPVISGDFGDPDGDGVHGLNERIRVKVLYDSRDYLYRLMKIYADQPD